MTGMKEAAQFLAALADGNRLRLLHLMKDGEICVCFLQGALKTNQPKISRHLAYLRRAGLVEARREGKWMYYRLKKLAAARQKFLKDALALVAEEPQILKDTQRARQIQCAPARYGLPAPPEAGTCCAP
jgi:ArsR family transcriptional regulator